MRIAGTLHVRNRPRLMGGGLMGLGQTPGTTKVNPYPNGVSVAHTGPNNTATTWTTAYHVDWDTWVANSGFGLVPIFRDGEMSKFTDFSLQYGWTGHGIVSYRLRGLPHEQFLRRLDGTGESADGIPGLLHFLEILNTVGNPTGGDQRVWYTKDASGYWIPSYAEGHAAQHASIWGELAAIGAIIIASVVTYGAAAGWFAAAGAAEAGAGAAAGEAAAGAAVAGDVGVGAATAGDIAVTAGSVADVGAATVAPEIASFTVPEIAAPEIAGGIDIAQAAPLTIDAAQASTEAAAAATSPLNQAFSISKYVQQLAGLYKTVTTLPVGTTHPQAGQVMQLPDGSTSTVQPNGSIIIVQPGGSQTQVAPGGIVSGQSANGTGLLIAGSLALSLLLGR